MLFINFIDDYINYIYIIEQTKNYIHIYILTFILRQITHPNTIIHK